MKIFSCSQQLSFKNKTKTPKINTFDFNSGSIKGTCLHIFWGYIEIKYEQNNL